MRLEFVKYSINRFLFFIAFLIVPVFVTAQNSKKVAVMETKNIEGVSAFQSNMVRGGMEVAVANADGYEGYDRAAFDVIMKEHNFQRSGAVDDKQIREMGIMAGVQYVLVTEASTDGHGFFILAKLLDVETGQYGNAVNTFCNALGQDIYKASNELGKQLFVSSANTQIVSAGIVGDRESVFRPISNEVLLYSQLSEYYCDGVYDPDEPINRNGHALHSPELKLNRNHFRVVFSFKALSYTALAGGPSPEFIRTTDNQYPLVLMSRYRNIIEVCLYKDATICIIANHNCYKTNLTYSINEYKRIDMEYYYGQLTINGQQLIIDMNTRNDYWDSVGFHSVDYSVGTSFKGSIKDLQIYSYSD